MKTRPQQLPPVHCVRAVSAKDSVAPCFAGAEVSGGISAGTSGVPVTRVSATQSGSVRRDGGEEEG